MVALWVARWGLLVAGVIAVAIAVAEEIRARRLAGQDEPDATDSDATPALVE
jgi:hypothetical protein